MLFTSRCLTALTGLLLSFGALAAPLELSGVKLDESIADGVVHVSAAHESTATLGPMFGQVSLERA